MTDKNAKTCHFCGHVAANPEDRQQWWHLTEHQGLTGLACSTCMDRILIDPSYIAAIRVAAALTENQA